MSMIQIEHLTFSYPASFDTIFDDVSIQFDTDWKLGLTGRNGRGKTTLLKLLQGLYEYRGTITSSVEFDYFPYPVTEKDRLAVELLQEICPFAEEWEFMRELSYLDMDSDALYRQYNTLSNGEQTKVMLAALFLKEDHFLLIDEPTNHLDANARKLVSAYLNRKKGFLLVSHDRCFLDGCVDHILSLNRTNMEMQSGNFSSYMENFQMQQEFELAQNERLKKDIRRLEQSARRTCVWSDRIEASKIGAADKGFVGHKAAKMMKRSKSIEARQKHAMEEKSKLLKNVETAENLKLTPLSYHADTLASFSEVSVLYQNRAVCPPVSFSICQNERIALDGKNGSGKSSLLKLLMGETLTHSGTLKIGSGIQISYAPQDASFLQGRLSDFTKQWGIEERLFFAILRKLDFERIQFEKDMEEFSEGQKKKVLLAKSLCEPAHLYVWDEPLNFIDVYSRMQIEQLILTYSPAMLFVEHDAAFRDRIATKTIELP